MHAFRSSARVRRTPAGALLATLRRVRWSAPPRPARSSRRVIEEADTVRAGEPVDVTTMIYGFGMHRFRVIFPAAAVATIRVAGRRVVRDAQATSVTATLLPHHLTTHPNMDTVLVTGSTGRVGRLVVDALLRDGVPVRALTRRPERAALPARVDVARGDLTAPESIAPALRDVGAVFLVWTAPLATAAAVVAQLAAATSAHASEPARRVVYLSAPHRTRHPFFQQPNPLRDLHVEVERLLRAAAVDDVVLRPGMFASNALHWWAPQIRNGDVVRWPYAAAETAPIDERDVAAAAARALVDGRHAGGDYVLTGPASLSQAAQVHAIGEAIGRPLRFEELTPDEFRRETAGTWPTGVADMLLAAWRAALGQPAFVTAAVEAIVESPPRSFLQWAADHAAAFAPARNGR